MTVITVFALAAVSVSAQGSGRGMAGFQFDLDPARKPEAGVLLRHVTPMAPADVAGLRPGDLILELDGSPITDPNELSGSIRATAPGTKVVLTYLRAGIRSKATLVVADRVELTTRLASAGSADATDYLASMYWTGDLVVQDHAEALRLYKKAAELGNEDAQLQLAGIYYEGKFVQKDSAEAVRWLRLAADQGNTFAQTRMGGALLDGVGVAKDEAAAVGWFRRAAEKADPSAYFELGFCYWYGRGVPVDAAQALVWFRKAAETNLPGAENFIGVAYASGKGVALDPAEARRWYERAAEHGEPYSQNNLGYMFLNGTGGVANPVQAYVWFQIARDFGYDKPDQGLQTAAARLTTQQLSAARGEIEDWESASISLSTNAPGATVYLNNMLRATADVLGHAVIEKIPAGKYDLRISKPGYVDWRIDGMTLPKHHAQHFTPQLKANTGELRIVSRPGGAQIYINDEFRGASGPDGALVVSKVEAGLQKLRASLAGYKDAVQTVNVVAGTSMQTEIVLERIGPLPLSLKDLIELLHGGVSNGRAINLVQQRGVDFVLDDDAEKQIRGAGGDSSLLLAVAKSKH